jgi:hypothetical protein
VLNDEFFVVFKGLQFLSAVSPFHLREDELYRVEIGAVTRIEDPLDLQLAHNYLRLTRVVDGELVHENPESLPFGMVP